MTLMYYNLLFILCWILGGFLSIYLAGLAERYTSFRSQDEWVLMFTGPIGLLLVPVVVGMVIFPKYLSEQLKKPTIFQRIKNLGKGINPELTAEEKWIKNVPGFSMGGSNSDLIIRPLPKGKGSALSEKESKNRIYSKKGKKNV